MGWPPLAWRGKPARAFRLEPRNQPPVRLPGRWVLATLLTGSLALNLALAVWCIRPAHRLGNGPSTPLPAPAPGVRDAGVPLRPPAGEPAPGTRVASAPFQWSTIEADDYRQYIANLRAVGCPEETIRDLIAADLAAAYAPRARAILKPKPRAYWEKRDRGGPDAAQRRELQALQQEQDAVFRELLGGRFTSQDRIDTLFLQLHGNEQQLLFLPADKRAAALELLARSGVEDRELEMQARGQYTGEEEKQLFAEKLALLARVLDPREVEEFRLRYSWDAQRLRSELQYFPCTPEEFRTLLDARTRSSGAAKVTSGDLANRGPAVEQVRALFGEERAHEFERVTDIHYQQARHEVERFDLDPELADGAWEITRKARMNASRIATNAALPPAQRGREIDAVLGEADAELARLLGDRASRLVRRDLKVVIGATRNGIRP